MTKRLMIPIPIYQFFNTISVDEFLCWAYIIHIIECEGFIFPQKNLVFIMHHRRTNLAHVDPFSCQLWPNPTTKIQKSQINTETKIIYPNLVLYLHHRSIKQLHVPVCVADLDQSKKVACLFKTAYWTQYVW